MKRRALLQGLSSLLALTGTVPAALGAERSGPVRMVLVESGHYYRNDLLLRNLFHFLFKKGVVREVPMSPPRDDFDLTAVWESISAFGSNDRIRFQRDGFYSCAYDARRVEETVQSLRERIDTFHDVDLICSMGEIASMALVRSFPDIPIIILDDLPVPRTSGLLRDDGTLIRKNIHTRLEMNAFSDQVLLFHHCFPFKRLGHVALNTQEHSIDVPAIKKACMGVGAVFDCRFKHFTVNGKLVDPNRDVWFQWFFETTKNMVLKDHVDALYLPFFPATDEQFGAFVDFLCKHRIPAFASTGFEPVRRGILMGMGNRNISDVGAFEAEVLAQYLHGVPLHRIPMRFFCHTSLVLNLKTAALLGWNPPFDTLSVLEQVYSTHSPMQGATI